MFAQRDAHIRCEKYERNDKRTGLRNGFEPRTLRSKSGEITISVPQVRNSEEPFVPFIPGFEQGNRIDRALNLAIAEMYLHGTSTRKVGAIMEQICGGKGVSATYVSKCSAQLDEIFEQWRNRPLRDEQGRPFEVLLNPLALPSRVNTSTLMELTLGKIAKKQGKPIKMAAFNKKGKARYQQVLDMLEKEGLPYKETVFDPAANKTLENQVTTGKAYVMKLHHVVESKLSARGQGSYDVAGQPVKGGGEGAQAKRIGGLEISALMAKGAYNFIRDAMTTRGENNQAYWRQSVRATIPLNPALHSCGISSELCSTEPG